MTNPGIVLVGILSVGIFEDLTAMFLELASKTPRNQTNDKKARLLTNQFIFLFKPRRFSGIEFLFT